jgi:mono/diheme cytochrome c family protein
MNSYRHGLLLLLAPVLLALPACGDGSSDDTIPRGDPVAGERLANEVASPACSACHALAAAEWEGTTAPDLDRMNPGYGTVLDAIRNGPGAMPSYSDQLSEAELHDISAFVSGEAAQ